MGIEKIKMGLFGSSSVDEDDEIAYKKSEKSIDKNITICKNIIVRYG